MTIACPHCQALNKSDARFCIQCGGALGDPTAARTGDSATRPLPVMVAAASPTSVKAGAAAKTQRLGATTAPGAPLAEGELLEQGRYLVVAHLDATSTGNRYLVQDRAFRRCPQCGHEQPRGDDFCETCGAQLKGRTCYLLVEAFDGAVPARAAAVIRRGFTHRYLVNLRATFQAQLPGKVTRTYLLKEPVLVHAAQPDTRPARRLLDSPSVTLPQIFGWLRLVAELLDDATAQGVLFNALAPTDLLLCDNALVIDAAESAEVLDAARQPSLAAQHQRHLLQLIPALTYGQTLPAPVTAALAELQSAPAGPTAALVERLQTALAGALAVASCPLSLVVGYLSDVGLVREINEDSLTTMNLVQVYNSVPSSLHLVAVADGMGGHAAGEVASQLALKRLRQALLAQESTASSPAGPLTMLKQAGQDAAHAVHAEAQRTRSDMGTTLVAALVDSTQRKLYAINVGDSRLYKIDATVIRQVTKDHSLVQRLIDSGQLTPAEARHHPNANLIYRTLGERANVEIDAFEESLAPGEILLLCTDGLCGLVDDDELHRVVATASSPQTACTQLIELAKVAGGHDNITVIVVAAQSDNALRKERPA
jgi:serine/threonine protein phosphatase PrpC